jgi:hypothetical protein
MVSISFDAFEVSMFFRRSTRQALALKRTFNYFSNPRSSLEESVRITQIAERKRFFTGVSNPGDGGRGWD